jgi:hypothetical protein
MNLTEERLVVAADSEYDVSFVEDTVHCRRVVKKFFSLLWSGSNIKIDEFVNEQRGKLEGVFDAKHKSESHCSAMMFQRLGETLQSLASLKQRETTVKEGTMMRCWTVDETTDKTVVLAPRPPVLIATDQGKQVELAMGLVREAIRNPDETSIVQTPSRTDHAWVVFERPALVSSSFAAVSASADEDDKDGKASTLDATLSTEDNSGGKICAAGNAMGSSDEEDGRCRKPGASDAIVSKTQDEVERGKLPAAPADEGRKSRNKEKRSWTVRRILAVLDLKTTGKACGPFRTMENESRTRIVAGGGVKTKGNEHGPLAQAVMYTLNDALWGRAALGPPDFPAKIPTGVVACRDSKYEPKENASGGRNHWALAYLATPEECGGPFAFGVSSFGNLHDRNFAASSLAVYLHVMTSGMEAAMEWLEGIDRRGRPGVRPPSPPPPACMSGRTLIFGGAKHFAPERKLVATPVSEYGIDGFRTKQGELFRARLDLKQLKDEAAGSPGVLWCTDNCGEAEEVLIKVTSIACVSVLVSQGYLFSAAHRRSRPPETLVKILSQSLHGAYVTRGKAGLVQILPNLCSRGFEPLRPESMVRKQGGWDRIWTAFERFVLQSLVPLAQAEIVHPDIRAGFDQTPNLLYNSEKGSIVMVDLDSLCSFERWSMINAKIDSARYIIFRTLEVEVREPLDFVLLQVITVAEVWLARESERAANANAAVLRRRGDLLASSSSSFSSSEMSVDGIEDIERALGYYRERLVNRSAPRAPKKPRQAAGIPGGASNL